MAIKDCNACHESSDVTLNHGALWTREHRLYAEKHPIIARIAINSLSVLTAIMAVASTGISTFPSPHQTTCRNRHVTDWREMHPIRALDDPRSCYVVMTPSSSVRTATANSIRTTQGIVSQEGWSDLEVRRGLKHSQFNSSQCQTCLPIAWYPPSMSSDHAREARKNLTSCQSCHADGQVCLKCHSAVTGLE